MGNPDTIAKQESQALVKSGFCCVDVLCYDIFSVADGRF